MQLATLRMWACMGLAGLLITSGLMAHVEIRPKSDDQDNATKKDDQVKQEKRKPVEGFPAHLAKGLIQRKQSIDQASPQGNGMALRSVVRLSKRWQAGQTVKVAFKSGNKELHQAIEAAAKEWTNYANIKLDFGFDTTTGKYRTWKDSDTTFSADIRVSFDQVGYYSLVGNDSINPHIVLPGQESLNLEGFDVMLPSDASAVIMHEFGHAIGFEHEHQSPENKCDFRFEDDEGYVKTTDTFGQFIADSKGRRPGLYTLLGGPPNNWSKEVVDFNLKKLQEDSHAFDTSAFDKKSIMLYHFEPMMFITGDQSKCYVAGENLVLSEGDKAGAAKVYPKAAQDIQVATENKVKALQELSQVETLSDKLKEHYKKELSKIKDK